MEPGPSSEAASYAAAQQFPTHFMEPEFSYRVHNSHPPLPILRLISPVHTTPSYLSKIHFNVMHQSTSWFFLVVSFLLAWMVLKLIKVKCSDSCELCWTESGRFPEQNICENEHVPKRND
jgi:hypothetical protein